MATSDELRAQLDEAMAMLKDLNDKAQPIKDDLNAVTKEKLDYLEEHARKMDAYTKKQNELNDSMWKYQQGINNTQYQIDNITGQIEAMEAAEREAKLEAERRAKQAERDAEVTARFDKLTLRAPWREWAKDHQISAGHKIAQDRNVILADPMGLGKTLSSIVTVDMVERATTEATPEDPFLGEEKQVTEREYWKRKSDGFIYRYKIGDITDNPDDYEHFPAKTVTKVVNGIERPVGRKVLYLCPNALLRNVMEEWRMWAPHRNATFIGGMTKAERQFFLEHVAPKVDNVVVVCNIEAWRRDSGLIKRLQELQFDTIIIDEAHNAKDRKSRVWWGINELLTNNRPEYVIPMTGTPVLNKPQELFTLLQMVDPANFYHENDFLFTYCEQDEDGRWKFQSGGLDRLNQRLGKIFMRRTKAQAGVVLPEKTVIHHDLDVDEELYPEQAKARKQMRDHATLVIENSVDEYGQPKALSAAAVIALYTRLRQIETWPAGIIQYRMITDPATGTKRKTDEILFQLDVEESQKVDYVISPDGKEGLIIDAIEDERIVLFSQFKAPLREIKARVERAGYSAVVLDGDTPQDLKDEIRKDFDARHTPLRDKSKYDVVLCNYKVGGVGLNLTAATQMIILDSEWNPGKRDQAFDRIHRIGQENPVTIHTISMNKTIDEWLDNLMNVKDDMVEGFNATVTGTKAIKDALEGGLI